MGAEPGKITELIEDTAEPEIVADEPQKVAHELEEVGAKSQ